MNNKKQKKKKSLIIKINSPIIVILENAKEKSKPGFRVSHIKYEEDEEQFDQIFINPT